MGLLNSQVRSIVATQPVSSVSRTAAVSSIQSHLPHCKCHPMPHLLAHALMRWCAIAKGGGMKKPRLLQERF
jgi:hypothetical protein